MHRCQEQRGDDEHQKRCIDADEVENLHQWANIVFVSNTVLLEQSHVNKSDEVSLKAGRIYHLYRTSR